jgi:hypothetical protein
MNLDIYNLPCKTIKVLCHTTLVDPNDPYVIFYLKGNEYTLATESHIIRQDTKWEECILCWINQTETEMYYFGSRFVVKGNVYGQFPHFTDYFVCPIQRERDNKLNMIGI